MNLTAPIVTVRLHGPLADKYGKEHHFAIGSPREAVEALDANFPGFRRDFLAVPSYGVLADGDWRDETTIKDIANAPVAREIDFCPIIEGRIFAPIVAGLGWLGITGVTATILGGVIATGLMIGVSMLLAPKAKKKTAEDTTKDENYIFSGPENVTEQGVAVPVIYGQVFTGSVVVSAGLEVAEGLGLTGASYSWRSTPVAEQLAQSARLSTSAEAEAAASRIHPEPQPAPPGRSRPRYVPDNA